MLQKQTWQKILIKSFKSSNSCKIYGLPKTQIHSTSTGEASASCSLLAHACASTMCSCGRQGRTCNNLCRKSKQKPAVASVQRDGIKIPMPLQLKYERVLSKCALCHTLIFFLYFINQIYPKTSEHIATNLKTDEIQNKI